MYPSKRGSPWNQRPAGFNGNQGQHGFAPPGFAQPPGQNNYGRGQPQWRPQENLQQMDLGRPMWPPSSNMQQPCFSGNQHFPQLSSFPPQPPFQHRNGPPQVSWNHNAQRMGQQSQRLFLPPLPPNRQSAMQGQLVLPGLGKRTRESGAPDQERSPKSRTDVETPELQQPESGTARKPRRFMTHIEKMNFKMSAIVSTAQMSKKERADRRQAILRATQEREAEKRANKLAKDEVENAKRQHLFIKNVPSEFDYFFPLGGPALKGVEGKFSQMNLELEYKRLAALTRVFMTHGTIRLERVVEGIAELPLKYPLQFESNEDLEQFIIDRPNCFEQSNRDSVFHYRNRTLGSRQAAAGFVHLISAVENPSENKVDELVKRITGMESKINKRWKEEVLLDYQGIDELFQHLDRFFIIDETDVVVLTEAAHRIPSLWANCRPENFEDVTVYDYSHKLDCIAKMLAPAKNYGKATPVTLPRGLGDFEIFILQSRLNMTNRQFAQTFKAGTSTYISCRCVLAYNTKLSLCALELSDCTAKWERMQKPGFVPKKQVEMMSGSIDESIDEIRAEMLHTIAVRNKGMRLSLAELYELVLQREKLQKKVFYNVHCLAMWIRDETHPDFQLNEDETYSICLE